MNVSIISRDSKQPTVGREMKRLRQVKRANETSVIELMNPVENDDVG